MSRPRPRLVAYAPSKLFVVLAALLLAAVACSSDDDGGSTVAEDTSGAHEVGLQVFEGPSGSTIALVPVVIKGEGPFPFALDTGASRSLVDRDIVRQLGLETGGKTQPLTGVSGAARGVEVSIDNWQIGELDIKSRTIVSLDLPSPRGGGGLQGLLGSDVLSDFDRIVIDFEKETLVLTPRGD